jgi:aminoglycoside N3'-acetyltransferase
MTLNLLEHGGNILTLNEDFPNTIAHYGGDGIKVQQKVKILKENLEKLKNMNNKFYYE